ncbi:MAG: hypothetical protein A3F67_06040 [Verrucomicrobia bacterium RIFCSPHIGHO2_12_FULL_41_10]|nr:MAG: hypothetical protein A3F67_06040 [Verrucomicrobia bacterium RIFCSPHIGHO2_12_FULL_41_10]HLB33550.1 hypothetical protein [Chthoniobacterales bacterium]
MLIKDLKINKLTTSNQKALTPLRPPDRRGSSAFALPVVLWTIAFLAGLIMLVVGSVNSWLDEEGHAERVFRARQMALSGLAIAMDKNIQADDPILTKGDPKSREGESYSVEIGNEAGLINPNYLIMPSKRPLFQQLFQNWGVSEKDQESAIDGLYDWISPTELTSPHGAKRAEYEAQGKEGFPPNSLFLDAREMAMVIGFGPVMKAKPTWRNYFSTFNPGRINILTCGANILVDVLGITPEQADAWVKLITGANSASGKEPPHISNIDDVADLIGVTAAQRTMMHQYFRLTGDIRHIDSKGTCNGVSHHIIVVMTDGPKGFLLKWQEE